MKINKSPLGVYEHFDPLLTTRIDFNTRQYFVVKEVFIKLLQIRKFFPNIITTTDYYLVLIIL